MQIENSRNGHFGTHGLADGGDQLPFRVKDSRTFFDGHGPVQAEQHAINLTGLPNGIEEISFDAPEVAGQFMVIDAIYVREKLKEFVEDEDLSRFIL